MIVHVAAYNHVLVRYTVLNFNQIHIRKIYVEKICTTLIRKYGFFLEKILLPI